MRDNSTPATALAIVLLAAIAGGAYYLLVMRHPAPIPPTVSPRASTTWQTIAPRPGQTGTEASDEARIPTATSKGRTDTPIKCFDPEVGEFWTNAATCEGADLNKQLANPAPQVSSSSPVASTAENTTADKTTKSTAGPEADRATLMGRDYLTPEEEVARSRSDKDD